MTSTCASQPGPAPIPIVGICRAAVISAARSAGMRLEHDRERAGLLELLRLLQDLRGGLAAALHLVAAQPVDRLRGQTDVGHDGDPDLDEPVHQVQLEPLDLHRMGAAFLDETSGVAHAVFDRGLDTT